jgi:hypothetical protein
MLVTEAARQQLGRAALAMVGWSYLGYAYTLRTLPALHPPLCPFLALTGIPCPLCGMTRAWDAALHGDLAAAFKFHPLAPLALPLWIVATMALTRCSARVCFSYWTPHDRDARASVDRPWSSLHPRERRRWRGEGFWCRVLGEPLP